MKPKSMVHTGNSQQGSWSWLDRVQTKLESLYETEQGGSVFLQETGRMLETQVTKVGANVKKLYSEFVRELLLPLEVPGESQAWADAQARLKAPAIAGSDEKVPGEDQPGAEDEEATGDEQGRETQGQAEVDEKAASVLSASDSQEFELLAPPLFQAPPLEETHEDLRVKEGVTKLHLKLQEMQRIESDKSPAVQTDARTVVPAVEAAPAEPEAEPETDKKTTAELPIRRPGEDAQPIDKARMEAPGGLAAASAPADSVPLDVAADSDATELEFASETEGEAGRRDDDDLLSGNESDRSQRTKWYGAKGALPRADSGHSTGGESGKGGWFDWELV
ncbi:hypothetical protein KFL_000030380 [Klebsormidium nitens]|uniref:Uncharacterized protein n=1 Tax=Klebsormidium nitens TaxID=105231 RepID=A0A1Y1HH53_KLENI|nr:hypothetical protein KFL_000030380 [Klebsormidium nitens]|eukprot:GAQ77760.1 hypothetical protein KFL_000030380 [Klebsormidium nitens]